MRRKITTYLFYAIVTFSISLNLFSVVQAATRIIDPNNKYAWGTNIGWVNFNPTQGGVMVYADHLEGYAWAENIGWIRLGSHTGGGSYTYANTATNNYGVNRDSSGNLSGYAWSTTTGWINFNPTHSQATIDPATGAFDGYAWGKNTGWIHFKSGSYGVVAVFPIYIPLIIKDL